MAWTSRLSRSLSRTVPSCLSIEHAFSAPSSLDPRNGHVSLSREYCSPSNGASSTPDIAAAIAKIPPDRIRNFSIIAHIDHGKSTLADRINEKCTNRIVRQAQLLDELQVERDRGITVKANSASFIYCHRGQEYLLNLVDTPGHVDFSYEVSRALAACQGALLLVDAAQGIQVVRIPAVQIDPSPAFDVNVHTAQTVANFYLAFDLDLEVVPVLNKIDLPAADPDRVSTDIEAAFDLPADSIVRASAKAGIGIEDVLAAVVERMPPPRSAAGPDAPFRLLLFDAKADEFRGIVCMVLVKDGVVRKGDRLKTMSTGTSYEVLELGVMCPQMVPTSALYTGQVGYIVTGLKSTKAVRVGDTWHAHKAVDVEPLPGFKPAKAMMFAGIYPLGQDGFERLADAMDKLTLNDASVTVRKETSVALGPGFRCGFLGMLHMDVFMQRLFDEHGSAVLTTTPMVPYRLQQGGGRTVDLESPLDFPKDRSFEDVLEPTVDCTIIVPAAYTGQVLQLCSTRRGELKEHSYLSSDRCVIRYQLPLAELAGTFYSTLKSQTSGYATFDYEPGAHRSADLVRLDFLIHGSPVDALSRVLHRADAVTAARAVCQKLVGAVSRQAFEVAIQGIVDNKVVVRETIRATRKDVLAKCYGGDISRKRKLLEKQKDGKSRMRKLGAVSLDPDAFHDVMSAR